MYLKMLRLSLLLLGLSFWQTSSAQCEYRLDMFDSFGDGWNGSILTITTGGDTYSFTLNTFPFDGVDSTVIFLVNDNAPLTISWAPSFFNTEVSFQLYDYENNLVYGSIFNPAAGVLFTGTGDCPSCLKPINITTENVWDNRARISWTPVGDGPFAGWWVVYGPAGFVPGPGVGDTAYVTTPKVTITGLDSKTKYDYYVVQDCDTTGVSGVAGPFSFETYWTNDVGISAVLSPVSGCDLGTEEVTIVLSNFGSNPQSLILYDYSVNGVPAGVPQPNDGFYTGVLGKDSSATIAFETFYDFSEPGEYVIKVWASMMGDEDVNNDTFTYYIVNRLITPYSQDFENWSGGWYVDTINSNMPSWEFGTPTTATINSANSGVNCWVTNLEGTYNSPELSYLNSPCFDFSDISEDPVLEFAINYDTELNFDGGFVEMSIDGGNSWDKVGAIDEGLNWYNFINTFTNLGDVWAGNSNGWITARHRLFGAGGESEVRLRFVFGSDFSFGLDGMAIDDINIYVPLANDVASLQITTSGENVDCGLEEDKVILRFTNFGTQPQANFQIAYSLNDGPPVVQFIGAGIVSPDEIVEVSFMTTFDSRDGEFTIKAWTILPTDANFTNDTAYYTVAHLPKPVPFNEDFETDFNLPDGWTSNGFITNAHNNVSFVLSANLFSFNPTFNAETARYGPVAAGDSLRFDYRIVDFFAGTVATILVNSAIEVEITTDCGMSWTNVYSINSTTHTPTIPLQTVFIDLTSFAGQSIKVRFRGNWGEGDWYFDLDNVNLQTCPADMALTANITPTPPGLATGSATVNVGLANLPVTYLWSFGANTQTVGGLPEGTYTVTVTDALGCTDELMVTMFNTSNNEITGLSSLKLSPNPTNGIAMLNASFDRPVDVHVEVINLLGQRVWETHASGTSTLIENIELGGYPDGLYLVRLLVDGQMATKKLVKGSN